MSNTEIWDKLKRVPPEHLKGFQRAGGFKGTAIKPMWTIHRMTEVFGPAGKKWGIDAPQFQTVAAGDEIMVYCTVSVWIDDETSNGFGNGRIFGVGGDKVRAMFSSGPRNDDEAFKKAYTDALTNALKMLGAGADVHMGLWDGNKYVDEKPEPEAAPEPKKAYERSPIVRAEFERLQKGIHEAEKMGTLEDLALFWKNNAKTIAGLPADWREELEAAKDEAKENLKAKVAA